MTTEHDSIANAVSHARRHFEAMCVPLRPGLHRFCTRMTGSPCDGEDVAQDALIAAFYRLDELENAVSFRAWLFRIAHNKCIDLLRARQRKPWVESTPETESAAVDADMEMSADDRERVERALSHIVTELPPRERASILLRDVLDWSLEEIAEAVGSSVGAVKAALHRARSKLALAESAPKRVRARLDAEHSAVVHAYLAAFNRRDWDAVQALIADDARLEVVHRSEGPLKGAAYFSNYERLAWVWKLELALVDGALRVVHFRQIGGSWVPHTVVELDVSGGQLTRVRDYIHVDDLLRHCAVLPASEEI